MVLVIQPSVFAQKDSDIIPGRYIVLLKETASPSVVSESLGFSRIQTYEYVFNGMTITATESEISQFRNDPRVVAIEPDRIVRAFAQTLPTGINRVDADLNPISKIDGNDDRMDVDVAIVDTGIFRNHLDLNLFQFVNFAIGSVDDDKNGHGSHVAGIAAAKDNDVGVVGITPGARLWAVKVLGDTGQGSLSDVVKGIDYVTQHADQIEVANLSLGGEFSSTILDTAISNSIKSGVVYVVAAGNDGRDAATYSPAKHPQVITVSAVADSDGKPGHLGRQTSFGSDDSFASFSNFGAVVDIAAPGVDILSTYKDNGYKTISGTSMSSPHVAGAVALYIIENGRDLNGDGTVNEKDVAMIREGLINSGIAQTDPNGFSGDRDTFAEPLVSVAPSFQADFSLSIDQSSIALETNDSKDANVTLSPINGFVGTINLSVAASSQDISATILPDTIIIEPEDREKVSVLTVRSGNTIGNFSVTVTGKSSDEKISHSDNVDVIVNSGGGCLIATAAYGSELAPQVQMLRETRDNVVMNMQSGATFMAAFNSVYYSFAPTVADWERQSPVFKEIVKATITPLITTLSILNYVDIGSEVEMLGYGIGVILLNIGIYFAAPVIVLMKLRRYRGR